MSTPTADLPLDDRSPAIKFSYPFIAFFSTSFVVLRLWNNIRSKKFWYFNVSDWLLALAQVFTDSKFYCKDHNLNSDRFVASPEQFLATCQDGSVPAGMSMTLLSQRKTLENT